VSPVEYELGVSIPENSIFHSHCRENLKSYTEGGVFHSELHTQKTPWLLVHKRTIPTERQPLVDEI
jgi:hypothetical protein